MPAGRPSLTHQRRPQIVAALRAVMAEHGYQGASVSVIAERAGLSPGMVHHYFDSKKALLLALVEDLTAGVQRRFATRDANALDPRERVHAFIDAHLSLEDADPEAVRCWVQVTAQALRDPDVQALYAAATHARLELLTALVGACFDGPWQRPDEADDARRIAAGLLCAIEGAYLVASAAPTTLPPGFAAPTVRALAARLLEAR